MEHLINKEGVNRSAEKEAGGRNAGKGPIELLPCPFCGETGHAGGYFKDVGSYIRCVGCGAMMTGWERYAQWNQRAAPSDSSGGQPESASGKQNPGSSGGGSDGGAEFGERRGDRANTVPGQIEWILVSDALPSIPSKTSCTFLVTARSRYGKTYTSVARFANDYWLEWSDAYEPAESDIDDNGGKVWNGWMEDRLAYGGDDVSCGFDGEIMAWSPMPAPSDPNAPESSRDSSSPETAGSLDKGGTA